MTENFVYFALTHLLGIRRLDLVLILLVPMVQINFLSHISNINFDDVFTIPSRVRTRGSHATTYKLAACTPNP